MWASISEGRTWLFWARTAALPPLADRLGALLDAEEHARLARFSHPGAAQLFLLAHALCRLALSTLRPQVAPGDWRFGRRSLGQPFVLGPQGGLHFSLSHSGELAACAVQEGPGPLGLDVENRQRTPLSARLVRQCFTAREQAAWAAAAEPGPFSLSLWAAKEAYLKALGCGLHESMRHCEIVLRQPWAPLSRRSRRYHGGAPPMALRWGILSEPYGFALCRARPADAWPLTLRACDAAFFAAALPRSADLRKTRT